MNQNIHTQVARLHLQWSIGALDEGQESMVTRHLAECEECRDVFGSDADPGRRHLPAAMVAGWEEAQSSLTGLERSAVAEHLENCGTCRKDLQFLGFAPSLDAPPLSSPPPRRTPAPARGFSLRGWLVSGLGGVAVGAAAAVVLMMSLVPDPSQPPAEVVPWVAPSRTRGGASELLVPESTRQITLTVAVPTGCDPEQPAQVQVTGPAGAVTLQVGIEANQLRRGTVLVLLTAETSLASGEYHVEFRQAGEVLETSRFRLRHRDP